MVLQEVVGPKAARDYPDVRLAFLGGPQLIAHYGKRVARLKTAERAWVLETFGRIRAPEVVMLVVALLATPSKKDATAWLLAHADYCEPLVDSKTRDILSGPTRTVAPPRRRG